MPRHPDVSCPNGIYTCIFQFRCVLCRNTSFFRYVYSATYDYHSGLAPILGPIPAARILDPDEVDCPIAYMSQGHIVATCAGSDTTAATLKRRV